MSRKYFNHWAYAEGSHYNFKNIFLSQEDVCKKLNQLEYPEINPLTIRLCLLQESFNILFDMRLSVRQRTSNSEYAYHQTQNYVVSGVQSSLVVNDPGLVGEVFNLDLHQVYKNFYAFSSLFCSILDRLAYEIYLVHNIGQPNTIDWRKFKGKNGKIGDLFQDLSLKNKNLADIINGYDFSQILEIRDSFEHGKHLEINALDPDANFDFTIKNIGDTIAIVEFCKYQIYGLLQACNKLYGAYI